MVYWKTYFATKSKKFLNKTYINGTQFIKNFENTYQEIIKEKIKIDFKKVKIGGDSAGMHQIIFQNNLKNLIIYLVINLNQI